MKHRKNRITHVRFTEYMTEEKKKDPDNIFDPPLKAQEAINFLCDYLLGEDWYVVDPVGTEQVNTEIVHQILYKYSRRYRREYKGYYKKKNR